MMTYSAANLYPKNYEVSEFFFLDFWGILFGFWDFSNLICIPTAKFVMLAPRKSSDAS